MMGRRTRWIWMVGLLVLGIHAPSARAQTVSLTTTFNSHFTTFAYDGQAGEDLDSLYPPGVPNAAASSSSDGDATSGGAYYLANGGFRVDVTHDTAADSLSTCSTWGNVYFTVDQDVDYVAEGTFDVSGGRRVRLAAHLIDYTLGGTYLYRSTQVSYNTPDEAFVIGQSGGDFTNEFEGTLSGRLVAGHEYGFYYSAVIDPNLAASPSGALGSGHVSISFVTPVPVSGPVARLALAVVLAASTLAATALRGVRHSS